MRPAPLLLAAIAAIFLFPSPALAVGTAPSQQLRKPAPSPSPAVVGWALRWRLQAAKNRSALNHARSSLSLGPTKRLPARPGSMATTAAWHSYGRACRALAVRWHAARDKLVALSPIEIGRLLAARQGWAGTQWAALVELWNRESGWRVTACNASSGAYGIPQALPGSKMARFGADWCRSAITQIRWGLWYILGRYGSPIVALAHQRSHGWY